MYVHNGHNVKKYDSLIPNIDDIKKNLNVIERNIKKLRHIVEDIKVQIDRAMNIMEKYYSISKDIIEKFELYNKSLKNHRIIFSVLNIKESNENIMNDLNKIIYSEDLKNKCISLIDIYHEDRMIYTNNLLNNTHIIVMKILQIEIISKRNLLMITKVKADLILIKNK